MSHLLYAREPPSVTASPVLALVHHQVNTCKYPEQNGSLQGNTQHFFCEVEMVLKRKLGKCTILHKEFSMQIFEIPVLKITLCSLVWRTSYVCIATGEDAWMVLTACA